MSTPEIAFKKSSTTKTVTECNVQLLIRTDVYDFVGECPDNTFTSSNGFQIKCHNKYNNSLNSERMFLDHHARGKQYKFSKVQTDVEKLKMALDEMAAAFGTDEWTVHGPVPTTPQPEKEPRIRSKIVSQTKTADVFEMKLFVRSDVFDWVKARDNKFQASNDATVVCGHCSPEYNSCKTLWLNSAQCREKEVDMKSYLDSGDFERLGKDFDQVLAALKELKTEFLKSLPASTETASMDFSDWARV